MQIGGTATRTFLRGKKVPLQKTKKIAHSTVLKRLQSFQNLTNTLYNTTRKQMNIFKEMRYWLFVICYMRMLQDLLLLQFLLQVFYSVCFGCCLSIRLLNVQMQLQ